MSIPHIIHYCWFGRNPKPELIQKCIQSWEKYMPDWKIIEWNEDNFDVRMSAYSSEAYEYKKWAFVSDYARFWIIAKYGGIYFDTDVELLKEIPDNILDCHAFMASESAGSVNPGLVYGSIPNHYFSKKMLEKYNLEHFLINGKPVIITVNERTTRELVSLGFIKTDDIQTVDDIVIYPKDYFCGFDLDVREYDIKPITISVHHYANSWGKISLKRRCQNFIKKIIGVNNYRRCLMIKRKYLGIAGERRDTNL